MLQLEEKRVFLCILDERVHPWEDHPLQCHHCGMFICGDCFTSLVITMDVFRCVNCQGTLLDQNPLSSLAITLQSTIKNK